ncbi:MAG: hypothetical protein HUU55_16565 [Myxococcales bacterium]|nr:hypothetical protein [Myxococcales bacterium]
MHGVPLNRNFLALVGFFVSIELIFSAPARAETIPIEWGSPVSGSIAAGEVLLYSFDAAPGTRLFVNRTATNNAAGLNWFVDDVFGRRILSNLAALDDLGPANLMGGAYTLGVKGEQATSAGTFTFVLQEVLDTTTAITSNVPVSGAIEHPGQTNTYTFSLSSTERLYFDAQTTSNAAGIGWRLNDAGGNVLFPLTTAFADSASMTLIPGAYTLTVDGEGDAIGTYTFSIGQVPHSTAPISVNTTVDGAVTIVGETRTYSFSVAEMTPTYFDVLATSNLGGLNWSIQTVDGLVLAPFGTSFSDGGPYWLVAGDYEVRVRPEGDAKGTYSFRLSTFADVSQVIDVGVPVSTGLTSPGQRVFSTFSVDPGTFISIVDVTTTNNAGLNWILQDAFGVTVLPRTTSLSYVNPIALLGGEYTLTLIGEGDAVGSVTFQIQPQTITTIAAGIGETYAGSIVNAGDQQKYVFDAVFGQQIQLDFISSNNAAGFNWKLEDSLGRVVLSQTTSLVDSPVLPLLGGSYTLTVLGEGKQTGSFNFALLDAGSSPYVPTGTPLALEQVINTSLATGQFDEYVIELTEPIPIYLDLQKGASTLRWTFTDGAGLALFTNNTASNATGDDRGPYLLAAGSYVIRFSDTGGAATAYQFRVVPSDWTTQPIEPGVSFGTSPAFPGWEHFYTFTLDSPTELFFEVQTGATNLFWELRDGVGRPVFARSNATTNINDAKGPYVLAAGSYVIDVDANNDAVPNHVLKIVDTVTHDTFTTTLGQVETKFLSGSGDTHTYTFVIPPGGPTSTYFDVLTVTNNLQWSLKDPSGQVLFGPVNANIPSNDDVGPLALWPGEYELFLNPNGAVKPAYSFAITAGTTHTFPLEPDVPQIKAFAQPGDIHQYTLTLTGSPQRLFFDNQKMASSTSMTLRHADAEWNLASVSNLSTLSAGDRGPIWLPPGNYVLTLEPFGGAIPTYQFTLSTVVDKNAGDVVPNWVQNDAIGSPGGIVQYTIPINTAGLSVTCDLMSSPAALTWTLLDPVGTPVFATSNATNFLSNDKGPFSLAKGVYTLIFDGVDDSVSQFQFRIVSPEAPVTDIPPGCAACAALEAIFIFDTSASMTNDATQTCELAEELIAGLAQKGVPVTPSYWGITDKTNIPCLSDSVLNQLGPVVPGNPPASIADLSVCPSGGFASESFATATAVVAGSYPWPENSARLVVPVADEGPYCGDPVDSLDNLAAFHAGQVAADNNVTVSPIVPQDVSDPIVALASIMAQATGGTATVASFAPDELKTLVTKLANDACDAQADDAVKPQLVQLSPAPGSFLPANTPVVLQGQAIGVNALRPVVGVLVDGQLVQSLDAAGYFHAPITLEPGENTIVLTAVEECGSFDLITTWIGVDAAANPFASYVDITPLAKVTFEGTTFQRTANRLLVDVSATATDAGLIGPLLLTIGPGLHPSVSLLNADGALPDGTPYIGLLGEGVLLPGGQVTPTIPLAFDDPERRSVVFEPRLMAPADLPPYFTTVPVTYAKVGVSYSAPVAATDPNGLSVTLSLLAAPPGMTLTATNPAQLVYSPTESDTGTFDVIIGAIDGTGGFAQQKFSLSVALPGANQPPLFVSIPVVQSAILAPYVYAASAVDPDGDTLVYSLPVAPSWLTVDPSTGLLTATAAQAGTHTVVVQAQDPNGGIAQQSYVLAVGVTNVGNAGPVIVTTPPPIVQAESLYLYGVVAMDPDSDPITYTLGTHPAGVELDPGTGLLQWIPTIDQLGSHTITIEVMDNKGGKATQTWTLSVVLDAPNLPPFITSDPPLTALAGTPWTYSLKAIDPEFDPLDYQKFAGPASMTAAPDGTFTWTPSVLNAGNVSVTIGVVDSEGATAKQSFTVVVKGKNNPPVFTNTAPTTVNQGATYVFVAKATDPDNDPLTFSLTTAPDGATIHPTEGLLLWKPEGNPTNPIPIVITVSDGYGGTATLEFDVSVILDTTAPTVTVYSKVTPLCQGEFATVCISATDASGITSRELKIDGVSQILNTNHCVELIAESLGILALEGNATDSVGNVGEAQAMVSVANCNDTEQPVVTLHDPFPGSLMMGPTPLVVTISDNTPESLTWEVRFGVGNGASAPLIMSGVGPVENQQVALLDPTMLPAGMPTVHILVSDGVQTGGIEFTMALSADYKVGNFRTSFVDFVIPIAGIPLSVARTYDSILAQHEPAGDLGPGWRFSFGAEVNDSKNEALGIISGGLDLLTAQPFDYQTRVVVTKPDGERVGFTFAPTYLGYPTMFLFKPAFTADPGVTDTLEPVGGPVNVWGFGATFYDWVFPYNPTQYRLTTQEQVSYLIDEKLGLLHIEDANGNTLDITPDGVVSSLGVSLSFVRDEVGRVVEVIEPESTQPDAPLPGSVTYQYDEVGNLIGVTDQSNNKSTYEYKNADLPHHLTDIRDPLGRQVAKLVYTDDGRIAALCTNTGNPDTLEGCSLFSFDISGGSSTLYDARGYKTDTFLDDMGNTVLIREWLDDSTYVDTIQSYDAARNIIEKIDPDGNVWTYTYDKYRRVLTETDPDGFVSANSYAGLCKRPASECDVLGQCITRTFDDACRVATTTTPMGDTYFYSYDTRGLLTKLVDPEGQTWTFEYTDAGYLSKVVDPFGHSMTYVNNDAGDILSHTDRKGQTLAFTYDAEHQLLSETWVGQPGQTRTWTYNAAGQAVQITHPDVVQSFEYWPTGLLKSVTQTPLGAGPQLSVLYGTKVGDEWKSGYDGNGNLMDLTDSTGGWTHYSYGPRDEIVSVQQTDPDGSTRRVDVKYNGALTATKLNRYGDLAASIAGPVTDLTYSCGGCPQKLVGIDHKTANGDIITQLGYVRDGVGNILQMTDSEGVHSMTVDGWRRLVTVDHPDGSGLADENYVYDGAGNRQQSHQGNVWTYSQDIDGKGYRLVETDDATYAYDNNGNLAQRTDKGSLNVTTFIYDARDRLTGWSLTDAEGQLVSEATYGLGADGTRWSIQQDGEVRWVLSDGENPVLVVDESGQTVVRRLYLRDVDAVLAEVVSGQTRWLLTDHLGTVRDVVNTAGDVLAHYVYDGFGQQVAGPQPTLDDTLRYTAREFEPHTGLGYYRQRWYDPATGRFLQEDTEEPWDYVYARNAPYAFADPSGETVAVEYAFLVKCNAKKAAKAGKQFGNAAKTGIQAAADALNGAAVDPEAIRQQILKYLLKGLIEIIKPCKPPKQK